MFARLSRIGEYAYIVVEKSMKLLTEHANRNPFAARVRSG